MLLGRWALAQARTKALAAAGMSVGQTFELQEPQIKEVTFRTYLRRCRSFPSPALRILPSAIRHFMRVVSHASKLEEERLQKWLHVELVAFVSATRHRDGADLPISYRRPRKLALQASRYSSRFWYATPSAHLQLS